MARLRYRTVEDGLRRGFVQFELCADFLQARSKRFNLLLLACDGRTLLFQSLLFTRDAL